MSVLACSGCAREVLWKGSLPGVGVHRVRACSSNGAGGCLRPARTAHSTSWRRGRVARPAEVTASVTADPRPSPPCPARRCILRRPVPTSDGCRLSAVACGPLCLLRRSSVAPCGGGMQWERAKERVARRADRAISIEGGLTFLADAAADCMACVYVVAYEVRCKFVGGTVTRRRR